METSLQRRIRLNREMDIHIAEKKKQEEIDHKKKLEENKIINKEVTPHQST